jgi:hypothetical protein
MKNQEVTQDPYADGIANPIRAGRSSTDETPIDVGIAPAFPPKEQPASTIGSAAATTASDGLIGEASSTYENIADCLPNAGE